MAITINSSPDNYSSLHNPLWFVVTSNNTTQTNFKYVCDVYVNSTIVARLKSFPQPSSSKGIFDVASVIRNYWSSYFKPDISSPAGFAYTGSDIYVSYELKFGEEYNNVTYLNLTTTTKTAYNYAVDYLFDTSSNMYLTPTTYQTYAGYYLTQRDKQQVKFPNDQLASGYLFISSLCDAENTAKNHSLDVSVYNGTTTTNYTGASSSFKDFALIDISPSSINTYLGTTAINSSSVYYDVKFKIAGTQKDTTRVTLSCSQHDGVPLHFLNALGGYDTFIFTQVNRQMRSTDRKSYERLEWEYDATSTSMKRADSYGKLYGGTIPFSTRQTLTYRLISDWVNSTDYNWLKQLISSSEVYMERNNQFIPITISTNNWSEKKRYADKTYNIELDIQIGNNVNSQFR